MRILFASRNFFPQGVVGGAQASVKFLAQELQQRGHEVAILSIDEKEHVGPHLDTGIMEFRLTNPNPYSPPGAGIIKKSLWHSKDRFFSLLENDYAQVFERFKPDVLNTNVLAGLGASIWNTANKFRIPIVHTVHDYYLMCIKSSMRSNGKNCNQLCAPCRLAALNTSLGPSKYVSDVIYVSHHMKLVHERVGLFSENTKTHIIHGSYSLEETNKKKSLPDKLINLGFFGRISPEKGLEELLMSLKNLPQGTWILKVGGSGEEKYVSRMKDIAKDMPVEFLGYQEPQSFYASVDAVVIYSLWNEPAGRIAYEAGCHGVIPIVSNRGGLPELVEFGERGYIFDPEAPETLKLAIENLIHNPQKVEGMRAAWNDARKIFLPETVACQTLDIYQRAIEASR